MYSGRFRRSTGVPPWRMKCWIGPGRQESEKCDRMFVTRVENYIWPVEIEKQENTAIAAVKHRPSCYFNLLLINMDGGAIRGQRWNIHDVTAGPSCTSAHRWPLASISHSSQVISMMANLKTHTYYYYNEHTELTGCLWNFQNCW